MDFLFYYLRCYFNLQVDMEAIYAKSEIFSKYELFDLRMLR